MMMNKKGGYTFLVYIIFALYFINKSLSLITLPQIILDQDKWIVLIGAVLILWGGYRSMKLKEKESYGSMSF